MLSNTQKSTSCAVNRQLRRQYHSTYDKVFQHSRPLVNHSKTGERKGKAPLSDEHVDILKEVCEAGLFGRIWYYEAHSPSATSAQRSGKRLQSPRPWKAPWLESHLIPGNSLKSRSYSTTSVRRESKKGPSVSPAFAAFGISDVAPVEDKASAYLDSYGSTTSDEPQSVSDEQLFPGDLVELRSPDRAKIAVYVGPSERRKGHFINSRGLITSERRGAICYRIPGFVNFDAEEASLLSDQERSSPLDRQWAEAAIKAVACLRDFERELETARQTIIKYKGAEYVWWKTYTLATPKQRSQGIRIDANVAIQVLDEPVVTDVRNSGKKARTAAAKKRENSRLRVSPMLRIAMHQHLMEDYDKFIAETPNGKFNGIWRLHTPSAVQLTDTVRDWCRERSPVLTKFAENVQKIRNSPTLHPLDNTKRSSIAKNDPPFFSVESRKIIDFMSMGIYFNSSVQRRSTDLYTPMILKYFPEYNSPEFDLLGTTTDFLRSIGVFSPWQNLTGYNFQVDLTNWHRNVDEYPFDEAYKPDLNSRKKLEMDEEDAVGAHRRDFGQMPVYIVDDMNASELDDGISIEQSGKDSNGKQQYWLHVHISDPTTFLPYGHPITQKARKRLSAYYLPETTLPMLPRWFINSSEYSLGSSGSSSQGKIRVMTFSTLLNEDGQVQSTQVQPGLIQNTVTTTYDTMDSLLTDNEFVGFSSFDKKMTSRDAVLQLGPSWDPEGTKRPLSKLENTKEQELKVLSSLMLKVLRKRVLDGCISWNFPSPSLKVNMDQERNYHEVNFTMQLPQSYNISPQANTPSISLFQPSKENSLARGAVAEAMILAGRAAAKYCKENDIIALYRQQMPPIGSEEALQDLWNSRDQNGYIDAMKSLDKLNAVTMTRGIDGLSPGPHKSMGINDDYGYIRVTSPLRRFSDFAMHYQIKNSFIKEKESNLRRHFLNRTEIEKLALDLSNHSTSFRTIPNRSVTSWAGFLLKYKISNAIPTSLHHITETEKHLLNNLRAIILKSPDSNPYEQISRYPVMIQELGLDATIVMPTTDNINLEVGQSYKVSITSIILDSAPKIILSLAQ